MHITPESESESVSQPLVSVVIVSYNALPVVRTCLPSVVASSYPNFEIIFVDNGSADGTSDWIVENFPKVIVDRHQENHFFCRGNNLGVQRASGKYIVLLNNDVEVEKDWLGPLVERMETDPTVGAVQPKLLQYDHRDHFEYAGAAGGHLDRFGFPFTRGRIFAELETDNGQYDSNETIFWATGAALFMNRAVFIQSGMLDERFKMHMEEIDLCWRIQRMGYRIEAVVDSKVYHIGGASLPQGSPEKTYLNYRNNLLVLYKNLPNSQWRKIFAARLIFDGIAFVRLLVLLRPREALAIPRGYLGAHQLKSTMTAERPAPGEHVIEPFYRRSIVFDYFLRRLRVFSALPRSAFLLPDFARQAESPTLPERQKHDERTHRPV
jgi:GT2 family glycosyltransferase